MNKITIFCLLVLTTATSFYAQNFSTGTLTFAANYTGRVDVNTASNIVTLTLNGPSDRYFAMGFGMSSMFTAGADGVMYLGAAGTGAGVLSDRTFGGSSSAPTADPAQDWTVTTNSVAGSTRTIVATRNRASAGDYTFPATAGSIDFIWSIANSASYALVYHGGNRGTVASSLTLGSEKFEADSFKMFPNPATNQVSLQFPEYVEKGTVKIYDNLGRVVKNVEINAMELVVSTSDLSAGTYIVVARTEYGNSTKTLLIN